MLNPVKLPHTGDRSEDRRDSPRPVELFFRALARRCLRVSAASRSPQFRSDHGSLRTLHRKLCANLNRRLRNTGCAVRHPPPVEHISGKPAAPVAPAHEPPGSRTGTVAAGQPPDSKGTAKSASTAFTRAAQVCEVSAGKRDAAQEIRHSRRGRPRPWHQQRDRCCDDSCPAVGH
jgi:hypothetical protein